VFKDEIEDIQSSISASGGTSVDGPTADLDVLVEKSIGPAGLFPGQTVRWISLEDDRPEIWISLAPTYGAERKLDHVVKFDARTGDVLEQRPSAAAATPTFIGAVFWIHKSLVAGTTGELCLAVMALLFVVALVSGVVLYAPHRRKLPFGKVRWHRGTRLRWLDLHNVLGISTVAWALLVGVTGFLNEVAEPLYDHWRGEALSAMLLPFAGKPMPSRLASVQGAADRVSRALPSMKVRSVRFPDGQLGSPHHYLVWMIGSTSVTSRLFQPALIDATTGELSSIGEVPWYLTVVQLSRPLHFGDYGGLPLKLLWVTLDAITIVVLISGVALSVSRVKAQRGERPMVAKG